MNRKQVINRNVRSTHLFSSLRVARASQESDPVTNDGCILNEGTIRSDSSAAISTTSIPSDRRIST